jgi:hypothetical protein
MEKYPKRGEVSLLLVFLLGRCLCAGTLEEPLENTCLTLLATPFDRAGMTVLSQYSVNEAGNRQLRSYAMSVYALSALARQETNAFVRSKNRHEADFPDQKYRIRFDLRDCYTPCGSCYGQGFTEKSLACPTCKGSGKCAYKDCCNGHWITTSPGPGGPQRTASSLPCPVCKGTARCSRCNGIQAVRATCEDCGGNGTLFKQPPALNEHYKSLLRDMLGILRADHDFDARLQLAKAETNLETRVTLCNRLLNDYHQHARIGDVRELKIDAEKTIFLRSERVASERARIQKEIEIIRRQAHSNPKDALSTIQAYMAAHQADLTGSDKLDLTGMEKECGATLERQAKLHKIYTVVGGVLAACLGLSCINFHFYKYTLLPSYSGSTPSRASRNTVLTDPLNLSAKERRPREKARTAEIEPLNE